jgi:hypothetical protein
MDLSTSEKTSRGIKYEAYIGAIPEMSVGYLPDGSGILLDDLKGNEIGIKTSNIESLRLILRYCQAHCDAIIKENSNNE